MVSLSAFAAVLSSRVAGGITGQPYDFAGLGTKPVLSLFLIGMALVFVTGLALDSGWWEDD